MTPADRAAVLDSGPCSYCGTQFATLEVDHIVPALEEVPA